MYTICLVRIMKHACFFFLIESSSLFFHHKLDDWKINTDEKLFAVICKFKRDVRNNNKSYSFHFLKHNKVGIPYFFLFSSRCFMKR